MVSYFPIVSGAEKQVLIAVFAVDAVQQKVAQYVLPLEKACTDFRKGRQADQDTDGIIFGTGVLTMSGRGWKDAEISSGERFYTLVDQMDAIAGQDIDNLKISVSVLRNLYFAGLEKDDSPFYIGGDAIDITDDIQDMVPGDQRNIAGIVVHRHFGEQSKEIAKIRVGGG